MSMFVIVIGLQLPTWPRLSFFLGNRVVQNPDIPLGIFQPHQ